MIIFIRHGEDHSDDSATYKYDAKLTEKANVKIQKFFKKLIDKYGDPYKIYCSPYRRTRETARQIEHFSPMCRIRKDRRLGRYFTRKERKNPDIARSTKELGALVKEDKHSLDKRTYSFCKKMEKYRNCDRVVWVISHTVPLKRMGKIFGAQVPDWFNFLEHFIIE